jgi:pimeloyl-ACP methyl ester carboxylesterase
MPFIDLPELRIHYADRGTGTPVVLIHASTQNGGQWDGVVDSMPAGRRYLLPDLYDSGETGPWPDRRELNLDDEADLVLAVLERVGQPAHIAGHSYGGAVAVRIALRAPERLRSLSLIEPGGWPLLREAGLWAPHDEYKDVMDKFRAAVAAGNLAAAWRDFLIYYRGDAQAWAVLDADMQQRIIAKTPAQLRVYLAQASNPTRLADLARISMPTLVLQGDATTAPEAAICRIMSERIPGARLQIVAGAGHAMVRTHQRQVARALASFFGDVEAV